ncbi:MAG: tRNA (N6-isopentenyl adenosine(37)-C2)-methylthiotransferase MiaB, partial [Clostridia bacterium]|nr:tRNA (N6-isopentenyl adenosine(37)-C2)-methylthiotransferase MiaB [Clostridia bacterium]
MNVHESEKIAGLLCGIGYTATSEPNDADLIVFNTCCIRDTAEKKILGNIGDVKKFKKEKKDLIVAVVGCMTQQEGAAERLRGHFPFVNIVLGTSNLQELPYLVQQIEEGNKRYGISVLMSENPEIVEDIPVFRTSGTNAWVNIMYGCNNFCTYCIVPYVRGRERSRSPEMILREVKTLLEEGYKEITLLGQNVDSYSYDDKDFAYLLDKVAEFDGKYRIRFMTSHPKDFNSRVIDVVKDHPNICNSIHLPIQSGSNRILKLMNRHYTRERYLEIIDEIRNKIPNVGITSDIMVGFPTETEEDFEDTVSLVKEVGYSGAFTFV